MTYSYNVLKYINNITELSRYPFPSVSYKRNITIKETKREGNSVRKHRNNIISLKKQANQNQNTKQ